MRQGSSVGLMFGCGPDDCILICGMNRGYYFLPMPDWFRQIPCLLFSCYQVSSI